MIQDATTTGGGTQLPHGWAEKLSKLSRSTGGMDVPREQLTQAALDVYAYMRWTRGGADVLFDQYISSLARLRSARTLENCYEACNAGFRFIDGSPLPGKYGKGLKVAIAYAGLIACMNDCDCHIGLYR